MYRAQSWSWQNYWVNEVLFSIEVGRTQSPGVHAGHPLDPRAGTHLGDRSNTNATGTAGDDTIYGEGGHDNIRALAGGPWDRREIHRSNAEIVEDFMERALISSISSESLQNF